MTQAPSPDHRVFISDVLRVPHGFWGRNGGVSPAPWNSLNCGLGSNDDTENVLENRDRVRRWLGADALQNCWQTHSKLAHFIRAPLPARPKGDGLVTDTPGLAVAALAADCVPILFEDVNAGLVGACHAGWRGAVGGIVEATHAMMVRNGAMDIRAAIGPSIGPRSFEVQADFEATVMQQDPNADRFFRRGETLFFDLPSYLSAKLDHLGVLHDSADLDTYTETDRLFSYRRSQHSGQSDFGRNISAIILPH
jgi:hypothetical protein